MALARPQGWRFNEAITGGVGEHFKNCVAGVHWPSIDNTYEPERYCSSDVMISQCFVARFLHEPNGPVPSRDVRLVPEGSYPCGRAPYRREVASHLHLNRRGNLLN